MPNPSARKDISLKSLELFQICARKGSLRDAATETGLSISTVSHHLRSLEDQLGVTLFDHTRRPMVLTPKGQAFLRNIDVALQAIRKAKAEASAGDPSEASYLRIGTIEDLDSDVMPDLAVHLSEKMPGCDFLYHTSTSHEILAMLRDRELDLGITSTSPERMHDLRDHPLLRDPFVVVLPTDRKEAVPDLMAGRGTLPFLRFSGDLIIARQIEAQLRRLGVDLPHRFECASNQTLMAMVASGAGWTITTPLLYSRAKRFQARLDMRPFPGKQFSRTLSLVATPDCAGSILDMIDHKARASLKEQIIDPLGRQMAWLAGDFRLLD